MKQQWHSPSATRGFMIKLHLISQPTRGCCKTLRQGTTQVLSEFAVNSDELKQKPG